MYRIPLALDHPIFCGRDHGEITVPSDMPAIESGDRPRLLSDHSFAQADSEGGEPPSGNKGAADFVPPAFSSSLLHIAKS